MSTYEIRFEPDYPPLWVVYRDGERVSQHETHEAARAALAALPPRSVKVTP